MRAALSVVSRASPPYATSSCMPLRCNHACGTVVLPLFPPCMTTPVSSGAMCRLLSCTFLHAGVLHLGLNCLALYNIGPDVEAVFGQASFVAIYLLAGLGGSTASFLFSDLVTVGASGAIFGLLGGDKSRELHVCAPLGRWSSPAGNEYLCNLSSAANLHPCNARLLVTVP